MVVFSHVVYFFLLYTGWPKKNATLTINNFKKTWDRIKRGCTLSRIKLFSQQYDIKNANFGEGVLILWPLFWCNVIFKICTSISKVTIYIPKFFHCLASPAPRVKWLLLLCKAKPAWIKRSIHYVILQHYNPEELLKEIHVKRDFWYKRSKFWKWHCLRKIAVESKRLHQNP